MGVGPADSKLYAQLRKQLWKELPELSKEQVSKLDIKRLPNETPGGTSVKYVVSAQLPGKDGKTQEQKFTFKPAPDGRFFFERDSFANDVRRAADEPALIDVPMHLPINDHEAIMGWVRPRVGSKGKELSNHAETWTAAERTQVAVDAVWSEFLGNYDMKTDQYAVRTIKDPTTDQKTDIAFNKDWDLTLHDYEKSQGELDRYKTYKWKVPTAQNLLFLSYVHGEVDVDFGAMRDAVARIQGLSDTEVKAELQPFIDAQFKDGGTFGQFKTGDELVAAVLERKHTLGEKFEGFIGALQDERQKMADGPHLSWSGFKTWLKDERVRVLGALGNSPLLDAYNTFNRHKAEKAHDDLVVNWPS